MMDLWNPRPADRSDIIIHMSPDGEHVQAGLHVVGPHPGTIYWTKIAIPDLSAALVDLENERRALEAGAEAQADTVTFRPIAGGPARELKLRTPPQDGGQALEP